MTPKNEVTQHLAGCGLVGKFAPKDCPQCAEPESVAGAPQVKCVGYPASDLPRIYGEAHELLIPCNSCGARSGEPCKTTMHGAFHGARGWQSNPYLTVKQLLDLPNANRLYCDIYTTDDKKVIHIWNDYGHSFDVNCLLTQLDRPDDKKEVPPVPDVSKRTATTEAVSNKDRESAKGAASKIPGVASPSPFGVLSAEKGTEEKS